MTTLNRVVIEWNGAGVVGRAVTVLHWSASDNSSPPVAGIVSAFQAVRTCFPTGLVWTFPGSGDKIDDTTGNLVGVWSSPDGQVLNATGISAHSAASGACVAWDTGGIVTGTKGPRKLRGRTFLVPLGNDQYDVDGTLTSSAKASMEAFGAALQTAGPLAIWHRPTTATSTDGNSYGVIAHKVRDRVAILRSRRD